MQGADDESSSSAAIRRDDVVPPTYPLFPTCDWVGKAFGTTAVQPKSATAVHSIDLRFGDVKVPYSWGWAIRAEVIEALRGLNTDRFIVVTDTVIGPLFGFAYVRAFEDVAPVTTLTIGTGEGIKNFETLGRLCEEAVACGATRRSCVLALGGGVVGNVAGALAGLMFRGIRLIHIPTTMVAAYDSVVSLKQAVNSGVGKNHFGLFLPATAVFVDLELFSSLPEREFRSGVAELLKNSLAITPEHLDEIAQCARPDVRRTRAALEKMLPLAIQAKQRLMLNDKTERAEGLVLEYGHTIGHAIELVSMRRHGRAALSHGESVGLGMLAAAHISCNEFGAPQSLLDKHRAILHEAELPSTIDAGLDVGEIMAAVAKDNKRGYLNCPPDVAAMVLLRAPGKALGASDLPLVPVSLSVIEAAVRHIHVSHIGARLSDEFTGSTFG